MKAQLTFLAAGVSLAALLLSELPAQEGAAERIGRRIDQGIEQLTEEVQQAWADARKTIDKLGIQGRVYGRLRWDKALAEEPVDVEVEGKDLVILSGRVPDEETRRKALQLARDTVGVRDVADRLQIAQRTGDPAAAGK